MHLGVRCGNFVSKREKMSTWDANKSANWDRAKKVKRREKKKTGKEICFNKVLGEHYTDNSCNNLSEFSLFWNVLTFKSRKYIQRIVLNIKFHTRDLSASISLSTFLQRATSISKVKSVNRYGRNLTSRPGRDIERERGKKIGKAVKRGEKELGADAWIGMRHRLPKENHFALRPRYSIAKYPSVPRMLYVYCVASTLPCVYRCSSKQLSDTRAHPASRIF